MRLDILSCGASVAQSSEQAPFTSEIMGSTLARDSCMRRVCQRSAEGRGFSPGARPRFPLTEKVDMQGGLG
jgi:hypothetical protein